MRLDRPRQTPTFAQTVKLIQTMPPADQQDLEAIKLRHVALRFKYSNEQIHRALRALFDPARWRSRSN